MVKTSRLVCSALFEKLITGESKYCDRKKLLNFSTAGDDQGENEHGIFVLFVKKGKEKRNDDHWSVCVCALVLSTEKMNYTGQ